MLSLYFFTFTLPFALAGQKYTNPNKPIIEYPYDGAFCCDKTKNLVNNGHFEYGNANFDSSYAYDSDILPGQYDVTSAATDFVTTVTDHSYCQSPIQYSMNNKYLLVNGLTNQPAGSNSVIWQQKIGNLKKGKRYKFCANFRNLKQCTYDVLPVVTVQLSSGFSQTVTVNTDQDDSCDWQQVSFCFHAGSGSTVLAKIILKESSLGDGNDLAIDDVSIQELADPQLTTTIQHQSNSVNPLVSIYSISPSDDTLPEVCGGAYYWFVLTVDSYSGGMFIIDWSAPRGWGNSMMSVRLNPFAWGPPWHLTTSFPGFVFSPNKMYAFGMVTPECCKGCLARGRTYHIFYPSTSRNYKKIPGGDEMAENIGLTEKDLLDVEQWVGKSGVEKEAPEPKDQQPQINKEAPQSKDPFEPQK